MERGASIRYIDSAVILASTYADERRKWKKTIQYLLLGEDVGFLYAGLFSTLGLAVELK